MEKSVDDCLQGQYRKIDSLCVNCDCLKSKSDWTYEENKTCVSVCTTTASGFTNTVASTTLTILNYNVYNEYMVYIIVGVLIIILIVITGLIFLICWRCLIKKKYFTSKSDYKYGRDDLSVLVTSNEGECIFVTHDVEDPLLGETTSMSKDDGRDDLPVLITSNEDGRDDLPVFITSNEDTELPFLRNEEDITGQIPQVKFLRNSIEDQKHIEYDSSPSDTAKEMSASPNEIIDSSADILSLKNIDRKDLKQEKEVTPNNKDLMSENNEMPVNIGDLSLLENYATAEMNLMSENFEMPIDIVDVSLEDNYATPEMESLFTIRDEEKRQY